MKSKTLRFYGTLVCATILVSYIATRSLQGDEPTTSSRGVADQLSLQAAPVEHDSSKYYFSFEKMKLGSMPDHWKSVTGVGEWGISQKHFLGVNGLSFKQADSIDSAGSNMSICIIEPNHMRFSDLSLTVRLSLEESDARTGAGVVWHYEDEENFSQAFITTSGVVQVITREDGQDKRIVTAVSEYDLAERDWTEFKVSCYGDRISIFLNKKLLVTAFAESSHQSGKAGLISTARHATFDSFEIETPSVTTPSSDNPSRRIRLRRSSDTPQAPETQRSPETPTERRRTRQQTDDDRR